MNRSKYTEKFIAQNILNLPEYAGSADTHFDSVRPMNHAYVIPGGLHARRRRPTTRRPLQVGPGREADEHLGDQVTETYRVGPQRACRSDGRPRRMRRCAVVAASSMLASAESTARSLDRLGRRRARGVREREARGRGADAAAPPHAPALASPAPHARPASTPLSVAAQVGKTIFFDTTLSASGTMSCATCHDPDHAYGPPNDLAVQLGGPARTTRPARAPCRRCATRSTRRPTPTCSTTPTASARPGPAAGSRGTAAPSTLADAGARSRCCRPSRWRTRARPTSSRRCAQRRTPRSSQQAFGAASLDDATRAFDDVAARAAGVPARGPELSPVQQQVRSLRRQQDRRHVDGRRGARRSQVFNDANDGQLRARATTTGAGLNGSSALFTDYLVRGDRRAAQRRASPPTRTRRLLRHGRLRPAAHRPPAGAATTEHVLRHVQDADAAQRRHAHGRSSTTA